MAGRRRQGNPAYADCAAYQAIADALCDHGGRTIGGVVSDTRPVG